MLAEEGSKQALTKVPAVTLGFWVIKILATTLGETGGDTVTMTLNWGYVAGVALFGIVLVALVAGQILAKRFHATLYGRRSSPRRPSAPLWRISPIDRWESATPADRFCFWVAYWRRWDSGVGRREP